MRLLRLEGIERSRRQIHRLRRVRSDGGGAYQGAERLRQLPALTADDRREVRPWFVRDGRSELFPQTHERAPAQQWLWNGFRDDQPFWVARRALGLPPPPD